MKFKLDPPSGHSDSYLDVKFIIEFDKAEKAEFSITNKNINEKLPIISVNNGSIVNETNISVQNASSVEGYINIFPRDKSNLQLKNLNSVEIECSASFVRDNEIVYDTCNTEFYNESKSLDGDIIPFDITVHNQNINVKNNEPLLLTIISNAERKYELAIKNEYSENVCIFDVWCKVGKNEISVPSEVIFSDLEVRSTLVVFSLYWIKFEGINLQKVMNRKFVKIKDINIRFNAIAIMPKPQTRNGPTGLLDENFVLSDTYLVHTHKEFSSFGTKVLDPLRAKRLSFFKNEAMQMQQLGGMASLFDVKNKETIEEFKSSIRHDKLLTFESDTQKSFLNSFATKPAQEAPELPKKSGGCGCSRKKNA